MKKVRQQKILEVISAKAISAQWELVRELARLGIEATQSSISRDIKELGLVKVNGYYAAPTAVLESSPVLALETAGDHIIVAKTGTGQAQPVALKIDCAKFDEVVGTVAGDDTIFIAVKNQAAQRIAMKKITRLFAPAISSRRVTRRRSRLRWASASLHH
jgi:transcriptional regulator of arginine metabolism